MAVQSLLDEINQLGMELMKKKQQLAELRKEVPEQEVDNYQFLDSYGEDISLSELFLDKKELIVVHNMGVGCNYCTLWADGFNGVYHHLIQRAAFVVSTPDDPRVQEDIAAERGWNFPMVSTKGTTFKEDMGYAKDGSYHPGVSTFRKDENGKIYHYANTPLGPGDDFCSVWHLFDLLPNGVSDYKPTRKINKETPLQLTNNIAVQVKDYPKAIEFYEKTIGMKHEKTYDHETKLSFNGVNFFIEQSDENHTFFEFSTDAFDRIKAKLLKEGCEITKEYSERSIMMVDPYGMRFHLFESSNQ
ncbi:DUF899 family protein [Pseudalkalibacillus berkeleyi]|uniref:DUF899 family protein n=1 Tax=Pseudalkalibacillus berkeleyi TaxID=1069813 RepID=A0ABS9GYU6_9BACL|nr:DUF899 family protein [Pseudalkalibacillus berkeleyi]MCF6136702.1 DUF899 family protein [Pseudalkalibacillus berkeleyi]